MSVESPLVAMDTGGCHISESSLHVDQSPTSSLSRDLDILTSPASNIVSPTIMSPRRGQNKSKQLTTSSSKKELEIAEILSMLGSSPTKILVAQPQRIELERPQLYSDLESCTASIERVEQEFRHCVAPHEDVAHNENTLPVKDVQKRNDISADLPLASTITLPTSLTLSLPTVLPAWSTKNDLTSSLRPWTPHKADKVPDKLVTESIQPLGVFTPRVFNNTSLAPSLVSSHHDNNFTVTSTAMGPSSSTHVTTSIVDPIVPPILLSSQYANPTATTTTGTTRSLSNKLVIGGLSNNDTSHSTTTTTSSYMPFHTVLPFSFIPSGAGVSMPDAAGSSRYVIPASINNPMMGNSMSNPALMGNYLPSSTQQQQPHIRPLMLDTEEDRSMLRRFQKKRNRSSTDTSSSISLDTLPQVNNPDHVVTPTRSQAGLNIDLSTGRLVPTMMPTNIPSSSSIGNDSNVMTSQPDLTKTPLIAYPYQPNFLPYMLSRPMVPTWLDMQQKLNPTSTIRPPMYPSLMQSSQLIGFDPTGTLFKPQPQFPTLLSSPFLPTVSFGNNMDPASLQPPVRPFMASNPGTPTSTLSPTAYSSSMPILTKESPLLHSSFTNLSAFGGNNSSIGLNRATATPPIMTSAEVSPGRSAMTGSWPFNTQVSPMLGFGLTQGKFGSGSNQSSPLLGVPHVLPVSGSPLLISQLGNLTTDGGNKKDNNSPATGSQPVPDSKHSRRHYNHHQHKEQVSDKSDPKHKPGVITFVGHNKPNVSTATNNISNTSSPVNSDCYVVPSPGTSATATASSSILTTNSNSPAVTSEHQLAPKPPYMQNETMTPAVLPFQALVSKMMVKKPRSKKQTKTATTNKKDNSPKKPGRRGRKPAATTSMSSIITPSVVEKLAGTPLLGVIAPSGLDMGDLPGNKKEVKPSKTTPQHATPVVIENTKRQQTGKSASTSDQQVPTSSSSQPSSEVSLAASDASPAKMDSACSLLSLSQSVPATSDTPLSVSTRSSPVIITDKEDDSEAMGQVRRPSSVTAAEAMLMFTTNVVEEKSKVIEKVPSPLPVAKPNDKDIGKTTEVASTEDVIVVQDEPLVVEEPNHTSKKEPVCEEKNEDSSKEDSANCTAIKPPVPSSPLSHNEPKANNSADDTVDNSVDDTVEDDVPENNRSISETSQTETLDSETTATDNLDVDIHLVSEENVSCVEANDPASENTTLTSTEDTSTVDTDDTEMIDTHSNDQAETSSDRKNDVCGDTTNDTCIDTKKDTCKEDTCSDTKNDTCSDTKNDDIKNDTCSDMQDDTTVHMNQLAVTEVEISVDHVDDNDDDGELVAEECTENHTMEESEVKHQADGGDVEVQDNIVADGRSGDKSNWEEVSDDELLDTDLTPPLAKKSKADDGEVSDKLPLTLNLSQTEDGGNNVTVSSEASTPLLDDNIVPVRQVSVSSCISLYDDAMFEGDTFETAQSINGDTCENGVDDAVIVPMHDDKPDSLSKIKHINPTIIARRKYRTQSIDSEGSSYGRESRRDSNTLTLPDSRQERNKSASPRRKLQPDSTTSPKELETDYKESLHNPIDRNEWNSRSHKSRERGRNPRKQPLLHKNYGDHYDRQQGGNQRHSQNSDYRSSGRTSNTWSNSHYKHSNNNNYNNQHHSHYQQQSYPSEQDGRRGSNYKRHAPHYRDSNKNSRNSGRDLSQWNKRDHHGRKQEGCDSAGYRGGSTKFQHYSQDMNTTNHHYNNRGSVVSVHSHYSQRGRHGDRSYEQVSDEEPSSTAAGFKHQPTTGMLSISEASNSAVSDNSNSGSGSDSELESNHSSASRPVSRASSVKSSTSRSNKDRVYSRKEASSSSQRNRHHPYHHSKHNSTGYNSRRH